MGGQGGSGQSSGATSVLQQQQQRTELAKAIAGGFQKLGQGVGTQTPLPQQQGRSSPIQGGVTGVPSLPFMPLDESAASLGSGMDIGELLRRFGIGGGVGGNFQASGYKVV